MKNYKIPYHIFFIFLLLFGCASLGAQYQGGSGDGAFKGGSIQLTLNGELINPLALYRGGVGDGQDKNNVFATLDGTDLTDMFVGGNGDGHTKTDFSGTLEGSDLTNLYLGGIGDGHHKSIFQGALDGTMLDGMYYGGISDGHSKSSFTVVLDGTELAQLYQGGQGDGFNKDHVNTVLDGQTLSQLYAGGIADGFTKDDFQGVMNGSSLDGMYSGGSGDGFSKHDIQYIFSFPECTFVVNTDDDGFGSLRYAINCADSGDTIEFSPLLMDDFIQLSTGPLVLFQDIHINAIPSANLTVDGSLLPIAFLANPAGPSDITIRGLDIISGIDQFGGAIQNGTTLTLEDLDIVDFTNNSMTVIVSFNGGSLKIKGTVQILTN